MPGDDGAEGRSPLDELTESVRRRRADTSGEDLWDRFEPPDDDRTWERLGRSGPRAEPATGDRRAGGWQFAPVSPSENVLAVHGVATVGVLGAALLVYVLALSGLIPAGFWILSLPLLAIGLVGVVPVLALVLGIWNPQELG